MGVTITHQFRLDKALGSGHLNAWDVPYALFDISDFGHKIAYIPRGTLTDIYVANVDGSNPLKVTDSVIRTSVFGQDWGTLGFAISPDGQQIVFGGGGGQGNIAVINTDGSGARVLVTVEGLGLNDHYDWSPDGQRIVFESAGSGPGLRGVYVVNTDGSDLKLLFETSDMSMPVWSPDGQKIAFVHKNQIYVMDANGQNVTQLTNAGFNCCPAWSR
jgi:Tol biopolymer transport system component